MAGGARDAPTSPSTAHSSRLPRLPGRGPRGATAASVAGSGGVRGAGGRGFGRTSGAAVSSAPTSPKSMRCCGVGWRVDSPSALRPSSDPSPTTLPFERFVLRTRILRRGAVLPDGAPSGPAGARGRSATALMARVAMPRGRGKADLRHLRPVPLLERCRDGTTSRRVTNPRLPINKRRRASRTRGCRRRHNLSSQVVAGCRWERKLAPSAPPPLVRGSSNCRGRLASTRARRAFVSWAMSPHGPWLPITSERTIRACQVLRRLLPSPSLGTLTTTTRRPRTLTPPPSPSDPQNFATEPTDVFVCSYPKSGTTWMQAILAQIVTNLERASTFAHVSEVSPFFEIDPHWDPDDERRLSPTVRANHARFGRRCFNTHLPWSLMPRGGGAAYVYVVRDGRDAARSFHAHLSSQAPKTAATTKDGTPSSTSGSTGASRSGRGSNTCGDGPTRPRAANASSSFDTKTRSPTSPGRCDESRRSSA